MVCNIEPDIRKIKRISGGFAPDIRRYFGYWKISRICRISDIFRISGPSLTKTLHRNHYNVIYYSTTKPEFRHCLNRLIANIEYLKTSFFFSFFFFSFSNCGCKLSRIYLYHSSLMIIRYFLFRVDWSKCELGELSMGFIALLINQKPMLKFLNCFKLLLKFQNNFPSDIF